MSQYLKMSKRLQELREKHKKDPQIQTSKAIIRLDKRLKEIDKSIGIWHRPIGNYKPQWEQ